MVSRQISSLVLLWLGTAAKTAESATESTVTSKDIAEHREYVIHSIATESAEAHQWQAAQGDIGGNPFVLGEGGL